MSEESIKKINTSDIAILLKQIATLCSFKTIDPIWICGRKKNFGFRPSLEKNYLPYMTSKWIDYLRNGYNVVIPIVFYNCNENDTEKHDGINLSSDFLVFNHYNILFSYLDENNVIQIERYEPSTIKYQGDLNEKMESLFKSLFKDIRVNFNLVSDSGLQNINKDKYLCGHHILFWVLHRVKYGKIESVNIINKNSIEKFKNFCVKINRMKI